MNGVLRDYFPKGNDFEHLLAVENELHTSPPWVTQDRSPATLFGTLLVFQPVASVETMTSPPRNTWSSFNRSPHGDCLNNGGSGLA